MTLEIALFLIAVLFVAGLIALVVFGGATGAIAYLLSCLAVLVVALLATRGWRRRAAAPIRTAMKGPDHVD